MGLLAAGITMGIAAVFPPPLVFPLLAAFLGLVVGLYPGLAMATPEEGRSGVKWTVAVLLLLLGLTGLWMSPLLLAAAWLLHGMWSLLHRVTHLGDGVPEEVSGACLSYALVMAAFATYMWGAGL
jgi:hypothetical protein